MRLSSLVCDIIFALHLAYLYFSLPQNDYIERNGSLIFPSHISFGYFTRLFLTSPTSKYPRISRRQKKKNLKFSPASLSLNHPSPFVFLTLKTSSRHCPNMRLFHLVSASFLYINPIYIGGDPRTTSHSPCNIPISRNSLNLF